MKSLQVRIETQSKKGFGKKLRLVKETIRELKDSDLKQVAGGAIKSTSKFCHGTD